MKKKNLKPEESPNEDFDLDNNAEGLEDMDFSDEFSILQEMQKDLQGAF